MVPCRSHYGWAELMVTSVVERNLRKIRAHTESDPLLQKSHHFLYDRRYDPNSKVDYILMGINPGETKADFAVWPKSRGIPTEETTESEFTLVMQPSRSAKVWRTKSQKMLGTNVLLTELFFWSTPNVAVLRQRFSKSDFSAHIKLCATWNNDLFELYRPKLIVFTGFASLDVLATHYAVTFGLPPADAVAVGSRPTFGRSDRVVIFFCLVGICFSLRMKRHRRIKSR
jgi:hypothetical protein